MVISPYWTCMDILGTVPRVNKTGNVTKKRHKLSDTNILFVPLF
uniref:Uncharacterized protein n=1 Tax=Anguilla anguilla TaxID=7936 RepID=A0A0E9U961_ANGAN